MRFRDVCSMERKAAQVRGKSDWPTFREGAREPQPRAHRTSKFEGSCTSRPATAQTGHGGYVTTKVHIHERDAQSTPGDALRTHALTPPPRTWFHPN